MFRTYKENCMRICKIGWSIALIAAFPTQAVFAQTAEDNVYKIIITTNPQTEILETGFKLKGRNKGIITCLHGVAGGKFFTALGEKKVFKGLTITFVDIDHDLALLQSNQLNEDEDGLDSGISVPPAYKRLKVLGYPAGMGSLNEKSVSMGHPNTRILGEILPANLERIFVARKSPSLNSQVLYVEGQMIPGHSGSPLLDEHNFVHGVIIGGVEKGSAGITWAIPISQIKWTAISTVRKEIDALNQKNVNSLFAFHDSDDLDSPDTPPVAKPIDMNGPWELVQKDSRTLHADGTLDNTHWTTKGQLLLTENEDKSISGKFSDRSSMHFSKGEVSGRVISDNIELKIICTAGSCSGTGIVITGKLVNNTIIAKIKPLEDRPAKCMLFIGQQVTLMKN